MIDKKEDNIRSESFYPDSNYYLDQDNTPEETPLSEDQISNTPKFEWPNTYWFIAERTKAILDIDLTAIGIGAISNKVISYPIQTGAVSKVLKN